ncbi:MAG TPA: HAD family acid phosphatase [Longimicrobium sp.]|nr:HAD family acid phosphatase [Longimicrobium sp.]
MPAPARGRENGGRAGRGRPRAVIWDLDGTLADDRARAHFVEVEQGRARDWESYFDAIDQDPPIAASMEVLRAMHGAGLRVLFLTGRPEYTRPKTERWLRANGLTEYDELVMRPHDEFRSSSLFKVEEVARLRRRYDLVCAFEDRIDVAEALRKAGVPVFLYGAGAEAAAEALEAVDATQDELLRAQRPALSPRRPTPAGTQKPAKPAASKKPAAPRKPASERKPASPRKPAASHPRAASARPKRPAAGRPPRTPGE